MNQRKIILILIGTLGVIVILVGIISLASRSSPASDSAQGGEIIDPTGIIASPENLAPNELDVIDINPDDQSTSIPTDRKIEITFSRTFTADEFKVYISPDVIWSQEVEGSTIVITPENGWAESTQYDYSVVFRDDNQKPRLYSFITEGEGEIVRADTGSQELFEEVQRSTRINEPDIYLVNNVPFENEFFSARADFDPQPPAHYYIIITPKIDDSELVQQAVNGWLQKLQFSIEQIPELDIRYE